MNTIAVTITVDNAHLTSVMEVAERLRAHGIPTTIRDTRGQDIDGACGQLAASTA